MVVSEEPHLVIDRSVEVFQVVGRDARFVAEVAHRTVAVSQHGRVDGMGDDVVDAVPDGIKIGFCLVEFFKTRDFCCPPSERLPG